jgi:MYXO-CTERM domain-containing protein
VVPGHTRPGQFSTMETKMRKPLVTTAVAAALTIIPMSTALATTPPSDPNDVAAVDSPVDENDDGGFDDWGLFGLLGLLGLLGLKRRNEPTRVDVDRTVTR